MKVNVHVKPLRDLRDNPMGSHNAHVRTDRRPLAPGRWRWRWIAVGVLLIAYALLTWGVVVRSPLTTLDHDVFRLDLRQRYPGWFHWLHTYVMVGQRAPATMAALPWFFWRAWRSRSLRPLVTLVVALVLLNLSVGAVKIWTGRRGPSATHTAHAVFAGGDIFPSGHVSNAVVLYGVIAILAVGLRRTVAVAAVLVSVTVGLSTIYLDTHWLTDVIGGWIAGSLVLLVLPSVVPWVERTVLVAWTRLRRAWLAVRPRPEPEVLPVVDPVPVDHVPEAHVAAGGGPVSRWWVG